MKKIIFSTIILILAVGFSVFVLVKEKKVEVAQQDNNAENESEIIFFYGDTCPHCLKVEKFFADNKIEEKISFDKKEVYRNKANARQLRDKARFCGLSDRSIGVPFLWTGDKCLVGDKDIVNFFKEKLKIKL